MNDYWENMDNYADYQCNELDGELKCENCHKRVIESKALFYLDHPFCSKKCLNECVDFEKEES